jgi:hypothetical protein
MAVFSRKQQRSIALAFSSERRKIKGLRSFLAAPSSLLNVVTAVAKQERHRRLATLDNPILKRHNATTVDIISALSGCWRNLKIGLSTAAASTVRGYTPHQISPLVGLKTLGRFLFGGSPRSRNFVARAKKCCHKSKGGIKI